MENKNSWDREAAIIELVKTIQAIGDKINEDDVFLSQIYGEIETAFTVRQSFFIILRSAASKVSKLFQSTARQVQQDNVPFLDEDLEDRGCSSQTSSGLQQTQEAEAKNNRPEEVPIRWNPSSIKHRSKLEEFRKDPSKIKVGNIYFSRNEKYIIGSGSNRTQIYLGIKEDGTEVAIKRITKNPLNNKDFENELKLLQDLNLESKNIVKYVDLAQDEDFYYLALQLCEYDLEDYMEELCMPEHEDKGIALKKLVKEMLLGLQVLHQAKVIHRDIKPRNVLIDSGNNTRLADFGLSHKLEEGSTVYTARAGTRGWEAVETLDQSGISRYKRSSDIQVAGMLVYYILSDRKHAFDVENMDRETNIREGNYCLKNVQDIVAKDLIKRMISRDPAERPTVDEALQHPYFWDDNRKDAVLRKLGDRDEVQNYEDLGKLHNLYNSVTEYREGKDPTAKLTIDEALRQLKIKNNKREVIRNIVGEDLAKLRNMCDTAKKYTEEKTFSSWKPELSQIWPDINKQLPEDLLGLLRVLRNKLVHERKVFDEKNMLNHFPDFYISLHGLAKDLKWEY